MGPDKDPVGELAKSSCGGAPYATSRLENRLIGLAVDSDGDDLVQLPNIQPGQKQNIYTNADTHTHTLLDMLDESPRHPTPTYDNTTKSPSQFALNSLRTLKTQNLRNPKDPGSKPGNREKYSARPLLQEDLLDQAVERISFDLQKTCILKIRVRTFL